MKPGFLRFSFFAAAVVSAIPASAEGLRHAFCATYPGSDLVPLVNAREKLARGGARAASSNTRAAGTSRSGDVAVLVDANSRSAAELTPGACVPDAGRTERGCGVDCEQFHSGSKASLDRICKPILALEAVFFR